ncbi:hypothetical protein SBRCBS47491_001627 [Sporothrix bragantina]|uniref:Calcineurin-like phosphoesterase domain-containing protein n=1 Tax=Sporothrix bragantina TaxID=671064 RepID=A0ABP0B042_9PEZI
MTRMTSTVKTRILILSDTCGQQFPADRLPKCKVDLVLYCGNLTKESKISEYHTTIDMLKSLDAPMKLVIPGNNDYSLDKPSLRQKILDEGLAGQRDVVIAKYGLYGEAQMLFDLVRDSHGIHLLDEGTHKFTLPNGATFSLYASPFTSSPKADGAFQSQSNEKHEFKIENGVDIVMTHCPPAGIFDRSRDFKMQGDRKLFEAIERAQPRLHCFGHIRYSWGGSLSTWRDNSFFQTDPPSHFACIDNLKTKKLDCLWNLRVSCADSEEAAMYKTRRQARLEAKGYRTTSHCNVDSHPIVPGKKTLFINASIMGDHIPFQLPWVVEMELPCVKE